MDLIGPLSAHAAPPYGSFIGSLIPVHVRPYTYADTVPPYEISIMWCPPVLICPDRIP